MATNEKQGGCCGGQDWTSSSGDVSRRDVLGAASIAAGMLLLGPWGTEAVLGADAKIPPANFVPNASGDGIVGPFGEARIFNVGDGALPVIVTAVDGVAEMNLSGRVPTIRLGTAADETAITITSAGMQLGKGKPVVPWSAAMYKQLVDVVSKDRAKARGLILLRSALNSSYPVAVQRKKARSGKKMAASMAKHAAAAGGAKAVVCTTSTVTDQVTTTITQTVEVIKTAEKQYQECYDKTATKDPCKAAGLLAGACAAAVCAATAFVDMVVGFVDVVTTTTEDVVRTVVACVRTLPPKVWPNPWNLGDLPVNLAVSQPKANLGPGDIDAALKLLKQFSGFLGPFGTCMLEGKWSLAQLDIPIDLGNGTTALPFGVQCCISAACATQLSLDQIAGEYFTALGAGLSALAAMSPEIATALAGIGIAPAAVVATAVAAVPPAVVTIAAIILGVILVALYWAGMIAAQLFYYKTFTNALADGLVCIEHPSFALALIALLPVPGATVAALLVPPIVTG